MVAWLTVTHVKGNVQQNEKHDEPFHLDYRSDDPNAFNDKR